MEEKIALAFERLEYLIANLTERVKKIESLGHIHLEGDLTDLGIQVGTIEPITNKEGN